MSMKQNKALEKISFLKCKGGGTEMLLLKTDTETSISTPINVQMITDIGAGSVI